MHIAYLIPTIDRIGGAEKQLMLLAAGMARRGWRVTVIALSGNGGQAAQDLSVANVSFLSLQMPGSLASLHGWHRLRRWISSAQPEVIHAHLAQASLMGRLIRLLAPVRVLIDTIHSPATGSNLRQLAYRLTSRLSDAVTAVSHTCAQSWLDARTLHRSELTVIPNGIDTERWKPFLTSRDDTQKTAAETAEFRWIAVGRLDAVKDYATLLHAFSMLPASARLAIAGSGPLEEALHLQARQLGIDDRVRFLGFQNDVRPFMQNSDAFVLSSRWEGLPIALMEASACGLPAVFTETPGSRELLSASPLPIAPVGDSVALAAAMKALMDLSKSKRRQLGESARRHVVASFDQEAVLTQFETLYLRLLKANPEPSRHRRTPEDHSQSAVSASITEM